MFFYLYKFSPLSVPTQFFFSENFNKYHGCFETKNSLNKYLWKKIRHLESQVIELLFHSIKNKAFSKLDHHENISKDIKQWKFFGCLYL
jgi:hypothetical protein